VFLLFTALKMTIHAPLPHPKYRTDIDGLRAIAVLSVVIFHTFPDLLKGGFIGVDIFFVISGFLISSIIFVGLEKDSFSFIEFYSRRIKRIFPALLLVLIACYVLGWFVLLADEYKQLGKYIAGSAGFIANFVFWQESGYFDNTAETKPLLHLWSLGIEEQFYLIWPLLLWFARKQHLNLLTVTLIVAITSFVLNISTVHSDAIAAFYSPQTRFWELLIGSVLAYITLYKRSLFAIVRHKLGTQFDVWLQLLQTNSSTTLHDICSLLGVLLILLSLRFITKETNFPSWWAILPTVGTALIISAGTEAWLNRIVLSNRLLVWFGLISFPLYLWHWPLLSFARIIESKPTQGILIAAVIISIVLAWLTYQFIEKPIRFGNHSKAKTITLLVLMIAVGCVGYQCYKNDGLAFRLKTIKKQEEIATLFTTNDYSHGSFHNEECDYLFPTFKEFHGCLLSQSVNPTSALVGDSHSHHYYKSLAMYLNPSSLIHIYQRACLPFSTKTLQLKDNCEEKINVTLSFLKKNESIKTVYLAGYWNYLIAGGLSTIAENQGMWRAKEPTATNAMSFQTKGEEVISTLIAQKKEVILLLDNPDLDFFPTACFDFRPFRLSKQIKNPCAMKRSYYEKRIFNHNKALLDVLKKFPSVKIFDPKSIFCDENYCWAAKDNQPLYADHNHLTVQGADLVIKELMLKYPSS